MGTGRGCWQGLGVRAQHIPPGGPFKQASSQRVTWSQGQTTGSPAPPGAHGNPDAGRHIIAASEADRDLQTGVLGTWVSREGFWEEAPPQPVSRNCTHGPKAPALSPHPPCPLTVPPALTVTEAGDPTVSKEAADG